MVSDTENLGGGTGGGDDDGPHVIKSVTGAYEIAGSQVVLLSRVNLPDPTDPESDQVSHVITLLAAGNGSDGKVDVRGSQGVRITAGLPPGLPTSSATTHGVEVIVDETQNVTIQRGLIPGVDQKIEMTPSGITVDGGKGLVTIQSSTAIKLSVGEGLSTITLDLDGITIDGLVVNLKGGLFVNIKGTTVNIN